jgi:hypothetical protein
MYYVYHTFILLAEIVIKALRLSIRFSVYFNFYYNFIFYFNI